LKKIVLTARVNGPEPAPPAQPQVGANQNLPSVPDVDTEQTSDDNSTEVQPDMQQAPEQAPEEEAQPDQEPAQTGQPVVKTPEHRIRKFKQQQQQQQQQQNQTPQPQPQQP